MTQPIDFSRLGEPESVAMTRIRKYAITALTQSWTSIPHVTHHDEADITVLEVARRKLSAQGMDPKPSPTAFVIKAVAITLKGHPKLNAAFDAQNSQFVLKKYYNMGVAIDTPTAWSLA